TEDDLATVRASFSEHNVKFVKASATDLPFSDETFDAVVMWEVLEHLPNGTEARAIAELSRVLRPGGRLFLSTPHATPATLATDPARWLIGHRHYSVAQVQSLARGSGLETERLLTRPGWWEVIHMNVMYVSKWVLRRRPLFERFLL